MASRNQRQDQCVDPASLTSQPEHPYTWPPLDNKVLICITHVIDQSVEKCYFENEHVCSYPQTIEELGRGRGISQKGQI